MEQLTIDKLAELIAEQIKNGNGKKKIFISNDEDGNGYHGLYFGFTPAKDENEELDFFTASYLDKPHEAIGKDINDFIVLG
jgi:hypothetical protein